MTRQLECPRCEVSGVDLCPWCEQHWDEIVTEDRVVEGWGGKAVYQLWAFGMSLRRVA